jgi:spore germination protein YaaH
VVFFEVLLLNLKHPEDVNYKKNYNGNIDEDAGAQIRMFYVVAFLI